MERNGGLDVCLSCCRARAVVHRFTLGNTSTRVVHGLLQQKDPDPTEEQIAPRASAKQAELLRSASFLLAAISWDSGQSVGTSRTDLVRW